MAHAQDSVVEVTTFTWTRDSHGLFDFEADTENLQTKVDVVSQPKMCIRGRTGVELVDRTTSGERGDGEELVNLVRRHGNNYWVDRPRKVKRLWRVVRGGGPGVAAHKLEERDEIKLGRCRFKIHQMVTGCGCAEGGEKEAVLQLDAAGAPPCQALQSPQQAICRICLLEGESEDDPLIAPCNCKGSVRYVHLGCLRLWVRSRNRFPDEPGASYVYRALPCELCKTQYPGSVALADNVVPLVDLPAPAAPFLVLQSCADKAFHILSLADGKPVQFGRSHDCEVRVHDVSISRRQATVRFGDGAFYLEDNQSKFGTSVAMKGPWHLKAEYPVTIQAGRTVINLSLAAPRTNHLMPLGNGSRAAGGLLSFTGLGLNFAGHTALLDAAANEEAAAAERQDSRRHIMDEENC